MKSEKTRLIAAIICYAALLAISLYVLLPARTSQERFLIGAVVAVVAICALKTIRHYFEDRDSE